MHFVSLLDPNMMVYNDKIKVTFKLKVVSLTVMRSSLSSRLAPSFLQEIVGSGCPRGGWHSSTAGSPTATITSTGFCRKSSRKTGKHNEKWNSQSSDDLMTCDHDLTMINHDIC